MQETQMAIDQEATPQAAVIETVTIPVVEETLRVDREVVQTGGVRIIKTVEERSEVIDEPRTTEEVTVERVTINRYITSPVAVRHEGDTMIVPLFEEVTVIEKRLLLKEELHITRRKVTTSHPRVVTLRRESATIERREPTSSPSTAQSRETADLERRELDER